MSVRIQLRQGEHVQAAIRRFKKIIERSGLMREVRRREHYQKPSLLRRIAKARKKKAAQRKESENGQRQ
jgi:small subunit ribosomal protein S21